MSVKSLAHLALVGVLAFGTLAFATNDAHATLVVDGVPQAVSTRAQSVDVLLREQGIVVQPHDVVSPEGTTAVSDGMVVRLDRGRLVKGVVDGQPVQAWTTATTVEDALPALGVGASGAAVSPAPSTPIPDDGMSVTVQLPDRVTVKHDRRRTTVTTLATTVGQVLSEVGVAVGTTDRLDRRRDAPVVDGTVITVTRVGVRTLRVGYAIARRVVRRDDPTSYTGTSKTLREGRAGRGVAVYRVVRQDGVVVRRKLLDRSVVRRPVASVVLVGTKPRPAPSVRSVADLNWAALAACESGGNPRAVNPAGYYGLYQFSLGTWASVGGVGSPVDASPAEQTYRAQLLFQRSGAAPWPVCGPQLFT